MFVIVIIVIVIIVIVITIVIIIIIIVTRRPTRAGEPRGEPLNGLSVHVSMLSKHVLYKYISKVDLSYTLYIYTVDL